MNLIHNRFDFQNRNASLELHLVTKQDNFALDILTLQKVKKNNFTTDF